ncbi:MAG TPA: heavy metal-responsive transcriptional regulator [Myxococcaceae bacterium]|nr:heavy metal-responsive transcriptional regulator [Myxococcaceae bacterium]
MPRRGAERYWFLPRSELGTVDVRSTLTLECIPGWKLREVTAETRNGLMRIGELARRTGVSPDLLRYYERRGLLPKSSRTSGGYREYPASIVKRVQAIRTAVALGFALDELAQIFKMRDHGGAPCRLVRALAGKKLEAIDERLKELTRQRKLLASVLLDWDDLLAKAAPGARAGLLDALAANEPLPVPSTPRPLRERFGRRTIQRR